MMKEAPSALLSNDFVRILNALIWKGCCNYIAPYKVGKAAILACLISVIHLETAGLRII